MGKTKFLMAKRINIMEAKEIKLFIRFLKNEDFYFKYKKFFFDEKIGRRSLIVAAIVVAADIEERFIGHGDQKLEIFGFKVAAGDQKVDALKFDLGVLGIKTEIFFIGHTHDTVRAMAIAEADLVGKDGFIKLGIVHGAELFISVEFH